MDTESRIRALEAILPTAEKAEAQAKHDIVASRTAKAKEEKDSAQMKSHLKAWLSKNRDHPEHQSIQKKLEQIEADSRARDNARLKAMRSG